MTESYGPIAVCAWNPDWDDLSGTQQARLRARQGVATAVSEPMRVVDDEMRDVPRDGEALGEVVLRGDNVMTGYYRDPEATAEAFRGGWFHTGDLGVMHPDGYVELRDRLKDIVISGGENIATIEVEQALVAHPSVAEAAVVGAPDEQWGEIPIAFVTARGGEEIDPDQLIAFARERLARFKVPKRIVVLDELPKTGTGKIQKFELRGKVSAAPALEVRRMKSVLAEFREFVLRGNLVDLAIAVVLGAAFGALVTSFVANLVTPLIAAVGGQPDFSELTFTINSSQFRYGAFLNALLSFLIIAAVIFFLVVKPVNALLARNTFPTTTAPESPTPDVMLLTEIRDLLREGSPGSPGACGR